jgi:predicted thioesterase
MIEIGIKEELIYTVKENDLAKQLSLSEQDNFPAVLSTSRMVALMELAAARLMKPLLENDQLSVGINVNVDHLAATPLNAEVSAIAIYGGITNQLHTFSVELHDNGGVAGRGTHTRAIVKTSRIEEGARKRMAGFE